MHYDCCIQAEGHSGHIMYSMQTLTEADGRYLQLLPDTGHVQQAEHYCWEVAQEERDKKQEKNWSWTSLGLK